MRPQVGQSLDNLPSVSDLHFLSLFTPVFCFPSQKNQNTHIMAFLLLELYMVCQLYHGYFELWANIHLFPETNRRESGEEPEAHWHRGSFPDQKNTNSLYSKITN